MQKQRKMSLAALFYVLSVLVSSEFGYGSIVRDYSGRRCVGSEKQALLLFKKSLIDEFNYLSSWVGDDCCAWHGIGCNNNKSTTSHVIKLDLRNCSLRGDHILNSSLLDLKYLTYMDLSYNSFNEIHIPKYFGSFKDLTYLNLSYSGFEGLVPHHLGNLSSLRYLDLHHNLDLNDNSLLSIDSMGWLSKLSWLEHLDLSLVDLSSAIDWFPAINSLPNSILVLKLSSCHLPNNIPQHLPFVNLTSLVTLDLGYNNLDSPFPSWVSNNSGLQHLILGPINNFNGQIPKSIGRLTVLSELDLYGNNFNGPIPNSIGRLTALSKLDLSDNKFKGLIPGSIGALTSLTYLNLYGNNFQGSIPQSIGNLTSLSILDLSSNNFQGPIPKSIGNLISLSILDLSENKFQGSIPQFIGNLKSLSELRLGSNKLSGSVPHEMGNLTELTQLFIYSNELKGCLPESFCQLSKLESLRVGDNQLSGSIPKCIGQLSDLQELDLASNSWEGFVSEHHFVNLTSLTLLSISSESNLVFNVSSDWVPPFQLGTISIESLKVGPTFPHWLLTQRQIRTIIMENTSISDTIPADWFVSLLSQASLLDLSNNDINVEQLSLISATPNHLGVLALSNNRLSGEFPAFLCNLTSLWTLVLSNNNFSGELPHCLGNLTELLSLDVMNNSLSGDIPVSLGSIKNLNYLNLHNNKFRGKLPLSFQNLTQLVALDVGKNNLSDILPPWTGEHLPYLKYFILRSNNFYGKIPAQLCNHPSIQVLNLAQNQIMGNIPLCFGNFSAMITSNSGDDYNPDFRYGEMIIDYVKGNELKYTSTLGFLVSIDLSNNNISGEIPEELMDLHALTNLNLAGNHLAGRIPDRIGKLDKLESLDLSGNELYGSIPQSLSDLNFLSHLNLSFNDLSGRIPTGHQLQTLDDPFIYAGNTQLCGRPILKPCYGNTDLHNVQDDNDADADSDSDDGRMWFYAGIGPGLLIGFLGFCASLHFIKSWRYSYFNLVERVFDKIAVASA